MTQTGIYKAGLSQDEVSEEALNKSGLIWIKVDPRERIISLAQNFIGVPYKFGASVLGDSPRFFDCSSFTAYLYAQAGIAIPRVCHEQYLFGKEISEEDALPGDLVFFKSNRTDIPEGWIGHEGVFIGNDEMIQAGGISIGYGKVVKEKIIESKYYPSGFMGYRRLIPDNADRFVVEIPLDRQDLRTKENLLMEIKSLIHKESPDK